MEFPLTAKDRDHFEENVQSTNYHQTEDEIRKQKKRELVNLVTELSREISRLDDMLDKVKSIVYNL